MERFPFYSIAVQTQVNALNGKDNLYRARQPSIIWALHAFCLAVCTKRTIDWLYVDSGCDYFFASVAIRKPPVLLILEVCVGCTLPFVTLRAAFGGAKTHRGKIFNVDWNTLSAWRLPARS